MSPTAMLNLQFRCDFDVFIVQAITGLCCISLQVLYYIVHLWDMYLHYSVRQVFNMLKLQFKLKAATKWSVTYLWLYEHM